MYNHNVYFISGPYDLTEEEFMTHYARAIRSSNAEHPDCTYIVGDLAGTDQFAQEFLRTCGVSPERVTIYHGTAPRNIHRCRTSEILDTPARFDAMTKYSTHDIVWCRPEDAKNDASHLTDAQKHIVRRRVYRAAKIAKSKK